MARRDSNQIDLRTQGGVRVNTVTPGNSVQFVFDPMQSRIGQSASGPSLYNYIRSIVIQADLTVVRATGGTTPVYADKFPMAIKSIGLTSPMFGTHYDPSVVNGIVAKELIEYPSLGYDRAGLNRLAIPGTDGTYTRTLELELPFSQYWNPDPDQWAHWLGWMNEGILELYVNDAANPFGVSAGVTITNVAFSVSLKMIPWPEIIIPPFVNLRKYEIAAGTGSNGPKLTNVGDAGALQGVDDAARLDGMFFSHQTGGFIGSGSAADITAISMPWRDQAQTLFPAHFFERYLQSAKRFRPGYLTSAIAEVDDFTVPYQQGAALFTGPLNDASARYTPLVFREKESLVSYIQKVKGNYPLDGMTFGTGQTNNFRVYTREIKQYSLAKCSSMLAAMGIDPKTVQVVPKLSKKNWKPVDPSKLFCFPRGVAPIGKAA